MVPVLRYPKQTLTVQLVFGNNREPSDLTKTREAIEKRRPDYYAPAAPLTRKELEARLANESDAFYSRKLEEVLPPNFTSVPSTGAMDAFISAQRRMIIEFGLRTVPFDVRSVFQDSKINELMAAAEEMKKTAINENYDRKNDDALRNAKNFFELYSLACNMREDLMVAQMAKYLNFAQKFYLDTKLEPELYVVSHNPVLLSSLQGKAEKLAKKKTGIVVLPPILEESKFNPIGSLILQFRLIAKRESKQGIEKANEIAQRLLSIHFTH